jgi:gamma-glutamyltranspeptidase/glutathione hydrolase
MRDLHFPGRSAARSANAMASTSQPSSTLAAIEILRAGGNALDAAIAACAVQCVTEPGSTGIGGDCFCLYQPSGTAVPIAYNGSGRAPGKSTLGFFQDNGIKALDPASAHVVTIPGAIDAWARLSADHGRLGLDRLLQPAIRYAEEGFAVHERAASDFAGSKAKLANDEGARATYFTANGDLPKAGEILRQPALAASLKAIAANGRDAFYTGAIAEDIVSTLESKGGQHKLSDFAEATGEYVTPITTKFRDYDVYQCPPNGVGAIALLMMNLIEAMPVADDPLSPTRLHRLIEATRLAYRDRNAFISDPKFSDIPLETLLSKDYAKTLAGGIDDLHAAEALPRPGMPRHDDTVYISVVDSDGNACSFINSLFKSFGSGIVAEKSGVILQNRGFGFVLEEGHPNQIEPKKRPMHTIIPGMVSKHGRPVMPFGVMGGHFQPVGQSYVLSSIVDHGLDPQEAINLARLFAYDGVVEFENGISDVTAAILAGRGHQMKRIGSPHGGGQAIWIDHETGTLAGGSDPRKDGLALGF